MVSGRVKLLLRIREGQGFYNDDYVTNADQEISGWLLKFTFLREVKTVIKSLLSWVGRNDSIWDLCVGGVDLFCFVFNKKHLAPVDSQQMQGKNTINIGTRTN